MVFDRQGDGAEEVDVGLGEWKVLQVSWIRMKWKRWMWGKVDERLASNQNLVAAETAQITRKCVVLVHGDIQV